MYVLPSTEASATQFNLRFGFDLLFFRIYTALYRSTNLRSSTNLHIGLYKMGGLYVGLCVKPACLQQLKIEMHYADRRLTPFNMTDVWIKNMYLITSSWLCPSSCPPSADKSNRGCRLGSRARSCSSFSFLLSTPRHSFSELPRLPLAWFVDSRSASLTEKPMQRGSPGDSPLFPL